MTAYYKAVRPDGTDFTTGTTRPVVGEWMPRIDGRLKLCGRGYHVSDAPGETLIGGSWPCRLFEVEIAEKRTPKTYVNKHKRVVHTYRPIRELPAWQALGPNGKAVATLIERTKGITSDEVEHLYAAWYAARNTAWYAARNTAQDAARNTAQDAARNAAWGAALDAARNAAWDAAWYAARNTARDAARNAAWYAAGALVVRDLLAPEQFDILYGSWASVIEKPV